MSNSPRTWIEISRSAQRHNLRTIQRVVGPSVKIMPVVKANAYGHGVAEIVSSLRGQSQWGIGVAYGDEALQARAIGYRGRVVVLSNWQTKELPELIKNRIELVVWDQSSLRAVVRSGKKFQIRPQVHIKIDTGTTRIGFLPNQVNLIKSALKNSALNIAGTFSHFANAEERVSKRTQEQLKRFTTLANEVGADGGGERHIACTAAILRYPEARFGLVRLGIGLYGIWPSQESRDWCRANLGTVKLQPVLSWYARLAQVKTVSPGTGIGYGSTVIAKQAMRIGVLPVGYADGYDRRLSNRGFVIIRKQRAPIVGRICMNLCMIDVTKIPGAQANDVVTLIGEKNDAATMAELCGTIPYEVTTRINWSLPRILV